MMAITGIPNYTSATPIECSVRCPCGLRYLIFTGDDGSAAKQRAVEMQATLIDTRQTPFMNCACGQVLDFTADECERVM
jgi:hypothetical protein